jgi:hypothetical protein
MSARAHEGHPEAHKVRFDENLRGVVVMVGGAVALVGLAFGAMVMFTSPDGWLSKAANSAAAQSVEGGEAQVASSGVEENQ